MQTFRPLYSHNDFMICSLVVSEVKKCSELPSVMTDLTIFRALKLAFGKLELDTFVIVTITTGISSAFTIVLGLGFSLN